MVTAPFCYVGVLAKGRYHVGKVWVHIVLGDDVLQEVIGNVQGGYGFFRVDGAFWRWLGWRLMGLNPTAFTYMMRSLVLLSGLELRALRAWVDDVQSADAYAPRVE